jgi:hypothetical protein
MHDNYDESEYNYPCCCYECGKEFHRFDLSWSYDFSGIGQFHLLCSQCLAAIEHKDIDAHFTSHFTTLSPQPQLALEK